MTRKVPTGAELMVRHRLRLGWEVWESPEGTMWAKTTPMSPQELEVVDEVLREIHEEEQG